MAQKKKRSERVDKRYKGKVRVGIAADGTPVYKWAVGKTKAEMEAAKQDLIARYASGNGVDAGSITFGAYAQRWYKIHFEEVRPSSAHHYQSMLNKHILPKFGSRFIRTIVKSELDELIGTLTSASSKALCKSVLNMIFDLADEDGLLVRNPAAKIKPPKGASKPEHPRRALTPAEKECVLHLMEVSPYRLGYAIYYYLGIRHAEGMALTWDDIDWAHGIASIHQAVTEDRNFKRVIEDHGKTDAAIRYIPIAPPLMEMLRANRGIGRILPMTDGGMRRMWAVLRRDVAAYAKDHGLEIELREDGTSVLTAHYFRHNFASLLFSAGTDLMRMKEWLGHKDIQVTLKIYTHLQEEERRLGVKQTDHTFDFLQKLTYG